MVAARPWCESCLTRVSNLINLVRSNFCHDKVMPYEKFSPQSTPFDGLSLCSFGANSVDPLGGVLTLVWRYAFVAGLIGFIPLSLVLLLLLEAGMVYHLSVFNRRSFHLGELITILGTLLTLGTLLQGFVGDLQLRRTTRLGGQGRFRVFLRFGIRKLSQ